MLINRHLRSYFSSVKKYPTELVGLIISVIGSALSVLFLGLEIKSFIGLDVSLSSYDLLTDKFLSIIILCAALCVCIFIRSKSIANIADKVQADIEQEAFEELVYLGKDYYMDNSPSYVINKYRKLSRSIHKAIEVFYSFFLRNALLVIGGVVMLFYSSWQLSCYLFLLLPLVIIPSIFLVKRLKKFSSQYDKKENHLLGFREEILDSYTMVQVYNKQKEVLSLSDKKKQELKKYMQTKNVYRSFYISVLILIVSLAITSIIWFGVYQVKNNQIDAGDFAGFLYFSIIVGAAFAGMSEVFADLSKGNNAAKEISQIFGYKSKFLEKEVEKGEKDFISFENVSLSKSGKNILNNVSFEIKKGEHVSIFGSSGQGKTSIVNLLLGLINPDSGEIICCNQKVCDQNLHSIRENISYVEQEPKILTGTIKENLLFVNPSATDSDIEVVLAAVNLQEELGKFRNGYNHHVGSRGGKLSAGQKQRLSIAMALIKFPEILILDEYASNLDRDNDALITKKIKDFMKGKTIISVSHNPNSRETSDKIFEIQNSSLRCVR